MLLSHQGAVLHALGEKSEARVLLETALAITEKAYGPSHPQVANIVSKLGLLLMDLGGSAEARPLLERALVIAEKTMPPDAQWRADIAAQLEDLARIPPKT